MVIRIKNLRLRTIIGIEEWERTNKQDLIINAVIDFDGEKAAESDDIADTVNYKRITKKIITLVEESDYFLLEKLCDRVLHVILEDKNVLSATVEIDKPGALRFTDSVSVSTSAGRDE
ncbi:MAG: dihydroneopterin aldolase [candidate division KSB1 bacterium]|jgi:D-erythro-7,8-dihydroneopterin triphosphate epimerase|nr:dihydroneopterin aldolase [candidate division KSB1 bacterium]